MKQSLDIDNSQHSTAQYNGSNETQNWCCHRTQWMYNVTLYTQRPNIRSNKTPPFSNTPFTWTNIYNWAGGERERERESEKHKTREKWTNTMAKSKMKLLFKFIRWSPSAHSSHRHFFSFSSAAIYNVCFCTMF